MRWLRALSGRGRLILFSVALLAELAVLGVGAFRLSTEAGALASANRTLSRLHRRAPFPSAENAAAARETLDELDYLVHEFAAGLKGAPFPQEATDPAGFSARAQEVVERFQQRAKRSGVQLPDEQEAGFSAYASGGSVPRPQDVPRLSRQLCSVELVAGVLLDCEVSRIDRLTRDLFEEARDGKSGRRPAARDLPVEASVVHPSGCCLIEKIAVSFTADEKTVWRVLNSFARSAHFMAVTDFSHRTDTAILQFDPAAHATRDLADLAYLSGGVLTGEPALSREERVVAGHELIRVDLVVDVYNFQREDQL